MLSAAVLSLFALGASASIQDAFTKFKATHGKVYAPAEEAKRLAIFADNVARVNADNAEHMLIHGEAVFGITKFMDLTPEEFAAQYLTYIPASNASFDKEIPTAPLVDQIDWRTKGALTPVKDQGQCGSCWAFSATEAIESYAFLSGKELKSLSPQQINSCDKTDGGCNGGNTETAYKYVVKAGGIESEESYPYTSGGGSTGMCKFDQSKIAMSIAGYKSVQAGENNLQSALADGPVSVCLAARKFQTYHSGILSVCDNQVDHCVQAVGFDTTNSPPYWIVRNSWGTSWGEAGFIRIEMGKDLCRISDDVTYPTF